MNTKTLIEIVENLSDPEQAGKIAETLQEELQNAELSLVDRAIIDAYLLQQNGKIAEAIEKWRSLANITEGLDNELAAHAWLSVGSLLSENDEKEEALSAYDKALHLKPDSAIVYNNRGATKALLEQYEDAISDTYNNRGYAKEKLGQPEEAIADYEQAVAHYDEQIRLKPKDYLAYNGRGIAKIRLGEYEVAISDFDEAIRLKPDFDSAHSNRGRAKNALGQYESALADCNEAICLKSDNAHAHRNRGVVKAGLGQIQEAKVDYHTALKLLEQVRDESLKTEIMELLQELENAE